MMKNIQHLLAAGFLLVLGTVCSVPAFAQVTTFQGLYDALSGSETTIELGGTITGTLQDEYGDPVGFELEYLIDRNITFTGDGTLSYTQAGAADEDYLTFCLDVTGGALTFNNTLTVSGGYSASYGTFYIEDGDLTNKAAVTFQKNYAPGVFLLGTSGKSQWTADGKVSFLNNQAYSGAGLYSENGIAVLAEIEARGNSSMDFGGVFYLSNASEMTVNGAAVFGGATAADGNVSESDGGALYIGFDSTATFNGAATFQNNRANLGGAVYLSSAALTFKDTVTISDNSSTSDGGAVYADMGTSALTFEKTGTFTGNKTAAGSGGALYVYETPVNFNADAVFDKNTANGGNGGAVYASGTLPVTITGTSSFTENSSVYSADTDFGGDGGAVYADFLGTTGTDGQAGWNATGKTTFSKNTARRGSALYAYSSSLKFGETVFSENTATFADGDGNYGGGAVHLDGSELAFSGNVTASQNTAVSGSGGAFFVTLSGTPDITAPEYFLRFDKEAAFTENSAKQGGAFRILDSAVSFGGATTFTGNTATGDGGALHLGGQSLLRFGANTQTRFENNTAVRGGALFAEENAVLTLRLDDGAVLDIAQGSSNAAGQNDVFLDSGSTLTLDTGDGAVLSVNSALRSSETDSTSTVIVKEGAGAAQIFGDTSQYTGSLTINRGDVKLDKNGTLGSTSSSILSITNGGRLIVTLPDEASGESDVARLNLNDLVLDTTAENALVVVRTMNEGEQYALFSMDDEDGSKNLDWWKTTLQLDGSGIGLVAVDGDYLLNYEQITSEGKSVFSVEATYDINNPNVLWSFVQEEGETRTVTSIFDNTLEVNKDKILTVSGEGTLKLNPVSENRVGALEGDGNLVLEKNLTTNASSDNPNLTDGTAEFSGELSGAGAFIKEGNYTQKLTGTAEDFTGTMRVNVGELVGNTDSLKNEITVNEDATLTFEQTTIADLESNSSRTFDGTLTGTGTVHIEGINDIPTDALSEGGSSSVVVFDRNSSDFAGTFNVDTGWMMLDNKAEISKASFNIGADGGLGGNGLVGGVTIAPGGAIQAYKGDLTVGGDLKFQTGTDGTTGKVYVSIGSGNGGVIDVTGTAFVSGAEVQIIGVGSDYEENTEVQFITGTIDGVFINDLSEEGKIEFVDETSDKTWTFVIWKDSEGEGYWAKGSSATDPNPDPDPDPKPVSVGISPNRLQVVNVLDVNADDANASAELKAFIQELNLQKTETEDGAITGNADFLAATQQLAGSVRVNGLQLGLYSPYRTVFNRLLFGNEMSGGQTIYNNGYGPISGMQYRGAGSGEVFRGQPQEMLNTYSDDAALSCYNPYFGSENNFWADVTHVQTETSPDGNSDGYGISRTGLLLGMDFQRSETFRIGGLFGYFAPYLWQNADRVEADDYHGGLYFQKNYQGTDVLGYIGYAHQSYDSRRLVDLRLADQGYSGQYRGNTSGDSASFSFEMSRPRYYGSSIVIRPLIGIDYYYTQQDGFAERTAAGNPLFALQYNEADYEQWFVRAGINVKKQSHRSAMNLRIQYINQFGSHPYSEGSAQFLTGGDAMMNIRGVNLGRDYLNLGGGINVFMNNAQSRFISFDYDVNMSRRTTAHGVSLILVERF